MGADKPYMYGECWKGRSSGGILLLEDGLEEGVVPEGRISLDISSAWKAGRLCSLFSRGCTEPLKGRERGRRIALG